MALVLLLPGLADRAHAWGNRTHPAIVRLAIETLPEGMQPQFRHNLHKLQRYSNEPDNVLRERLGREEAIRHFIDLDGYMPAPFLGFPQRYDQAVERVGKRQVEKYGIVPWVILRKRRELAEAFATANGDAWIRIAGHLAHYVADSHQPLHLTLDYDGQLSGSRGIHRRFEDRVVDARIGEIEAAIRADIGRASVPKDARAAVFRSLFDSYPGAAEIIEADKKARAVGSPDGEAYEKELAALTTELSRRQLRGAALLLGSLWRSAWEGSRPLSDDIPSGTR